MKQLTKQTSQPSSAPSIPTPRQSRSVRQEVRPMPQSTPDAYSRFVEDASPESKDAFYLKLAGILMKKSAS